MAYMGVNSAGIIRGTGLKSSGRARKKEEKLPIARRIHSCLCLENTECKKKYGRIGGCTGMEYVVSLYSIWEDGRGGMLYVFCTSRT